MLNSSPVGVVPDRVLPCIMVTNWLPRTGCGSAAAGAATASQSAASNADRQTYATNDLRDVLRQAEFCAVRERPFNRTFLNAKWPGYRSLDNGTSGGRTLPPLWLVVAAPADVIPGPAEATP